MAEDRPQVGDEVRIAPSELRLPSRMKFNIETVRALIEDATRQACRNMMPPAQGDDGIVNIPWSPELGEPETRVAHEETTEGNETIITYRFITLPKLVWQEIHDRAQEEGQGGEEE